MIELLVIHVTSAYFFRLTSKNYKSLLCTLSINFSTAPIHAYADDYAFFIQGLLDLYEACFDEQLIKLATDLQKEMDHLFWDAENNSGYHQTVQDPHIIIRITYGRFESISFFNVY